MHKCSVCNVEKPFVLKFYGEFRSLKEGEHNICIDCLAERLHHDDLVPEKM